MLTLYISVVRRRDTEECEVLAAAAADDDDDDDIDDVTAAAPWSTKCPGLATGYSSCTGTDA